MVSHFSVSASGVLSGGVGGLSTESGIGPSQTTSSCWPAQSSGREDRAPLIASNGIEAGVRGHAVEPWAQERLRDTAGAKQRLLHRVLGVRQGTEHAVTVDQQLAAMTLVVASERVHYGPPFRRCRWISIDSYL